jgi:predicted MFS family arabinose efflux permease
MRAMVSFHAGFSAAACVAALGVSAALAGGATASSVYGAAAGGYVVLAAVLARAPFPHQRVDDSSEPAAPAGAGVLLATPGVAVAVVLCTVCFFGDGVIEGFSALVLRDAADASAPLAGAGIAAFHGASLLGRLTLARVAARPALVLGGLGAAAGTLVVLVAPVAAVAAAGLLVVGFALAPVIPTTLSLAARAAPERSGAAVSLVTSVGYSAFLAGPPLAGALGEATSPRATLVPVVASTLALAAIAAASPSARRLRKLD